MLKVLCMISGFDGCGYYRIQSPAKYLNKNKDIHVKITSEYSKDNMEWPDLIVLQKQSNPKALAFVDHARKIGKKIITEVDDDYFNIPSWNPAFKHYHDKSQELIDFYQRSEAVTVTTPHLASIIGKHNSNTKVIPNYIDFPKIDEVFKMDSELRKSHIRFTDRDQKKIDTDTALKMMEDRFTIGWGGSPTHLKDLEQATDALIKLCLENKDILVVMMACATDRILNEIPKDQLLLVGPVPIFLYYEILSLVKFDIGICPIEDNVFNRSKSNLKFLEFSAFKFPCVVSNVENYAKTVEDGKTGLVVNNTPEDWYEALFTLYTNDSLRESIRNEAYNFVHDNYNIVDHHEEWGEFYRQIVKEQM